LHVSSHAEGFFIVVREYLKESHLLMNFVSMSEFPTSSHTPLFRLTLRHYVLYASDKCFIIYTIYSSYFTNII
jgi:hypothetical protein